MLEALWAVLIDLYHFVFPASVSVSRPEAALPPRAVVVSAPAVARPAPVLAAGSTVYIKTKEVPCYQRPVVAFDTQVGTFSFGAVGTVTLTEGQFAYVTTPELSGWVDIRALAFTRAEVVAELVSGTVYAPGDKETMLIRSWLHDECDGGTLFLPLQSVEFILYTLRMRVINLSWPEVRPRVPGTWQSILKGHPRVRISIEPKTGSVMEYFLPDRTGILALVESVHPDSTIIIKGVGMGREGEYTMTTLAQQEWRELRPVFISFI